MKLIRNANVKAVVRFVYMVAIALTLVYATAYAAEKKAAPTTSATATATTAGPQAGGFPGYVMTTCENSADPEACQNRESCKEQGSNLNSKMSEMNTICPGSAKGECAKRYKSCYGTAQTTSSSSQILAQIFGTPASSAATAKNCNVKPRDYFTRRKESRDKIESLGKDVKALEKEDNEIDMDYQKHIKELQEGFADEQKKLDDTQEEIESKGMEEKQAALESSQKVAKRLSELTQQKMNLRNDLSTATVNAQAEMLQVSDEIAQGDCIAQVKKFKDDMKTTTKATSAGNLISGGNSLKKQLEARFDSCMKLQTIRRQEIGRKLSEKVASINNALSDNERETNELNESAKQAESDRNTRIAKMEEKKQKAVKASLQKVQQLQGELKQAGESAKKQHASLQKAIWEAGQNRNSANAELLSLGVEDTDAANVDENKSSATNIATYDSYLDSIKSYNAFCCTDGRKGLYCTGTLSFADKGKVGVK